MSAAPLPTEPVPGEHYWLSQEQMEERWPSLAKSRVVSCLWCGRCKPRDESRIKPCKGVVRMTLRAAKRDPLIVEVPPLMTRLVRYLESDRALSPAPGKGRRRGRT